MRTYYINLDAAADRREFLENNFRQCASAGAELVRVPAVSVSDIEHQGVPGRLRASEKACLLSHRKALAASLEDPGHSLIVEDDALFGPRTFSLLATLPALDDETLDIVYPSVLIGDPVSVIRQFYTRRTQIDKRETCTIPLENHIFSGADSYVVRRGAKQKLLRLLDDSSSYDVPYDLLLQRWIRGRKLRAVAVFPFLTSLSPKADASTNGNGNLRWLASNCLRRLMSLDRDHYPGNAMEVMKEVDAAIDDPEADDIARILRVLLSRACDDVH